ncbi:FecR family protein [Zunongwangia sp.]|uniref:FecR family protein n=1 Tax=Zunongwangia sp. TaxID=1965325 RepID=UPI003AA7EAC8
MRTEFEKLEYLIEKYISAEISSEELTQLNSLLENKENLDYFKKMVGIAYRLRLEKQESIAKPKTVYKNPVSHHHRIKKIKNRNYIKIAAILVVALGIGGYFLFKNQSIPLQNEEFVTLEFSDTKTKKVLQEQDNFEVKSEDEIVLIEKKGDTLSYSDANNRTKITTNNLTVPFGKKMLVLLADGSKVHLNSGSKLEYPSGFRENESRNINLEGEAYFEVSHDESRPFIVHTDKIDVQVLGTTFAINAYANNTEVNTVLLEGSVSVKSTSEKVAPVLLKPGMLAQYSKVNNTLDTSKVNTKLYTAWVKGELIFEATPFLDIANTLERKFNMRISFKNKQIANEKFTAKFNNESLEQILKSFQKSYDFDYEIEQQHVIIH